MASSSLTLLCKPGSDGVKLGDCPFTHTVRMVLSLKGLGHTLAPTKPEDKPAWLLEKHNGALPCLVSDAGSGEGSVTDTTTIIKHIDETYPTPEAAGGAPLGASPNDAAADATGAFFGGVARYLKNTDDSKDAELLAGLKEQLKKLEDYLKTAGTPYLGGSVLGMADCSLAPKLFVMDVAGKHFKAFELDTSEFPLIAAYKERFFQSEAFKSTMYPTEEMLYGWGKARGQ